MRVAFSAAIDELTVDDVGPGEDVVDVLSARHVRLHEQRAVSPVHHATVDRRQVAQQRPGLGTALQVYVAKESRLLAALPIRHLLVAVLGDSIHLPLVDHPRLDALAQAETVLDTYAVGHECGVVGPSLLEGAVPYSSVGARNRIVVARHRPALGLALHRHGGDVLELLSIELNVQQRGVRIAQLLVDDLRVARDGHRVSNGAFVGVRRDTADAKHPTRRGLGQVDTHGPLVTVGSLAIHRAKVGLDVGAAIGGNVDGVLNAVPVGVAVFILADKARPRHPDTHSGKLGVAKGTTERVIAAQLDTDGGLVLD
ncbi:hypothetical protein D3C76_641540 [compost metagenome]